MAGFWIVAITGFLVCCFAAAVFCLLAALIVFCVKRFRKAKGRPPKKYQKVLLIVFLSLGGVFAAPVLAVLILAYAL